MVILLVIDYTCLKILGSHIPLLGPVLEVSGVNCSADSGGDGDDENARVVSLSLSHDPE